MTPIEAVNALIESGMSEAAIAALVGTTQANINRIRRGQHPRWSLGDALVRAAGGQGLEGGRPEAMIEGRRGVSRAGRSA